MDKVKIYLAVLRKHHFWVITGSTALIGLLFWFLAVRQLSAYYKEQSTKIEGEYKELRQITSTTPPNETWREGIDKATNRLKGNVGIAWKNVYGEQKEQVLKWPKDLGADFLAMMQALGPNDEIPVELRERYQNYVKEEFPRLLKIVDARGYFEKSTANGLSEREPQRNPGARGRETGGRARVRRVEPEREHDYIVVWENSNQEEIDRQFDWQEGAPTTLEVRYAQENLWVYRALLQIIQRVNARSTGHYNAKVKEIKTIHIGQQAAAEFQVGIKSGHILRPTATGRPGELGGMQPGGMQPGAGAPGPAPGPGGPMGAPGAEGAAAGNPLEANRYVNAEGEPLAAGSPAPAEFKRMPVYLNLFMDQREISKLLVECANSSLPVEIRQLRVRAGQETKPGSGSGGMMGGPRRGPIVEGRGDRETLNLGETTSADANPYDLVVELHGIIYIFNPPDKSKLLVTAPEGEGAAAAPGEQPPPAAPAAGEPPAAEAPAAKTAPAAEAQADVAPVEKAPVAEPPAAAPEGPADEPAAAPKAERSKAAAPEDEAK